ncbi:MAG: sodium:solute symporter family protein [bacterium]|nr:sodium:solute symporter family protein [bacterium]
MTLAVILVYLGLVLAIGLLSNRLFRGTGEDYFLATRSIGSFMLLMSLFGTHMTAFSLLGASAQAYRVGIGVFALMASSSALIVPIVIFFVGTRLWAVGKRRGYITQVQYFRERWDSDGLGLMLFVVLVALVVPYLLIGVMGGGVAVGQITDGLVPEWLGGLAICVVVMTYVIFGGLRGTAWVNTFQTLVFMILGAVTFLWIVRAMGGLDEALRRVAETNPAHLIRGERIQPLKLLTYTCLPLSVGMFPHIFMHWLTARRAASFRLPIVAYPLCIAIVWIPSVLLGVLGTVAVPGLEGPAASSILVRMIDLYAPGVLAGLLAAGVFAAIMSSLDSQVLALGTMFTQDVVKHHGFGDRMSEQRQILVGRAFVVGLLALTYAISLVAGSNIFKFGVWSFSGFAALLPVVLAALFWRRSTKHGAMAAVAAVVVSWVFFFVRGFSVPGYTVGGSGVMPVAVMLGLSALALVSVSLVTRPPERAVLDKFFAERP